jgi:inner membrane protein
LQRDRALAVQADLARARGHTVEHGRAMPVIGSLLLWRSLYVADGRMYADGLRLVPGAEAAVQPGGAVRVFTAEDLPSGLPPADRDTFVRFRTFADGFTARLPAEPDLVGDLRYSLSWGFEAVWGIAIPAEGPPSWQERRDFTSARLAHFLGMVLGTAGEFRPVAAVLGETGQRR